MVELKTKEEIEKLRISNKIVAEVLQILKEETKPGMTGVDIDIRNLE